MFLNKLFERLMVRVKLILDLRTRPLGHVWREELHTFTTLAHDEDEWSVSLSGSFIVHKRAYDRRPCEHQCDFNMVIEKFSTLKE
jgi:hypothetical protein